MKKLGQIREQYDLITEKEEAESRKLATLVRAGLFDSKKLPMLKRALSKDAKDMTPAERKILIELLDSLMAEVLQSPQVYSKVKQSVAMKEEKDFEYEMARSELKALIADAQKILSQLKGEGNLEAWVQSKITKAADYISAASDNLEHSDEKLDEAVGKTFNGYYSKYDPRYTKMPTEREIPTVIILKRKAIRIYPDNQKVALYYSQALDKYVTIPFGTFDGGNVNEAVKPKSSKDEERQALSKRIAAAQAIRDKLATSSAQKEKSDSLTTELPAKTKNQPQKTTSSKKPEDKEKAVEKRNKEFYDKKLTSKMDIGRAKVLMKKDPDVNLATRVGAIAGLAARRSWEGSATKKAVDKVKSAYNTAKGPARKVDTAFEETETKSKFFEKREQQKLDELAPLVAIGGGLAARAAAPHVARLMGQLVARGRVPTPKGPTTPAPKPTTPSTKPAEPSVPKPDAKPEVKPEVKPDAKPQPKPESKPEAKPETKVEPKSEAKPETKVEPKSEPISKPETAPKGRARSNLGRKAAAGAGAAAAAAGAALAGLANANIQKSWSPPQDFQLQARTSKALGNVRTGVAARDTALYRKAMQQNESVLQQLYSINENEEKTIQIGNESFLINNNIAKKVIGVYESVNKNNKEKIEGMLNESVDSFKKILSFAARQ